MPMPLVPTLMDLGPLRLVDLMGIGGLLLLIMAMTVSRRKRLGRQHAEEQLTNEERVERNKQLRGMRGDLEDLMVEIEGLAKRFAAQLDARSLDLERRLRMADTKIAELERLLERAGSPGTPGTPGAPRTNDGRDGPTASVGAAPAPPLGPTPPAQHGGRALKPTAQAPSPSQPPDPAADGPADRLSREVLRLAESGLAPPDIAARLQEHVGKIELILALRDAR